MRLFTVWCLLLFLSFTRSCWTGSWCWWKSCWTGSWCWWKNCWLGCWDKFIGEEPNDWKLLCWWTDCWIGCSRGCSGTGHIKFWFWCRWSNCWVGCWMVCSTIGDGKRISSCIPTSTIGDGKQISSCIPTCVGTGGVLTQGWLNCGVCGVLGCRSFGVWASVSRGRLLLLGVPPDGTVSCLMLPVATPVIWRSRTNATFTNSVGSLYDKCTGCSLTWKRAATCDHVLFYCRLCQLVSRTTFHRVASKWCD